MKDILTRLTQHENLSRDEAKTILTNITQETYNPAQITAFITVFLMRGITVEELAGFREALMDLCIPLDVKDFDTIDVCGTGGDGKDTFNISTISGFVVAGAGYKVAKHGNKSVSSKCGSSDVLQSLGYQFSNKQDNLYRQLEENNFCYLHAPFFHPALKSVGPIRRDLGIKTFFNMLGPLVNPAQPTHQLVGVFSLKLMRLYHFILEEMGHHYAIVHGLDGYDEISLTDQTKVIAANRGRYLLSAKDFHMPEYRQSDIFGGKNIEDAKDILLAVLQNECPEAHKNVVLANSALAINCFKETYDLEGSLDEARESIERGAAFKVFKKAISLSA